MTVCLCCLVENRPVRRERGAVREAPRQMAEGGARHPVRRPVAARRVRGLSCRCSPDEIHALSFRFGVICAFVSNTNTQEGVETLPTALRHTAEDTATYFNHTRKVSAADGWAIVYKSSLALSIPVVPSFFVLLSPSLYNGLHSSYSRFLKWRPLRGFPGMRRVLLVC